jgi:myb proto-oncogene protein
VAVREHHQYWPRSCVPLTLPQGIHQADENTCSSVPFSAPATTAMWDDQCPEVFWNMDAEEINQDVGSTI